MTIDLKPSTPFLCRTWGLGIAFLAMGCASEAMTSEEFDSAEYNTEGVEDLAVLESLEPAESIEIIQPEGHDGLVEKKTVYVGLRGVGSKKFVGVHGASKKDGASAVIWQKTDNTDTAWDIPTTSGSCYRTIRNHHSGKYLAPEGEQRGANVIQRDEPYEWALEKMTEVDGHAMYVFIAQGGRVLDVNRYGTENGSNLHIWDIHGRDNQLWEFYGMGMD